MKLSVVEIFCIRAYNFHSGLGLTLVAITLSPSGEDGAREANRASRFLHLLQRALKESPFFNLGISVEFGSRTGRTATSAASVRAVKLCDRDARTVLNAPNLSTLPGFLSNFEFSQPILRSHYGKPHIDYLYDAKFNLYPTSPPFNSSISPQIPKKQHLLCHSSLIKTRK